MTPPRHLSTLDSANIPACWKSRAWQSLHFLQTEYLGQFFFAEKLAMLTIVDFFKRFNLRLVKEDNRAKVDLKKTNWFFTNLFKNSANALANFLFFYVFVCTYLLSLYNKNRVN